GGGYGFLSRKLGLTCDSLRALELITFDGKKVIADENTNSDLLWACRGGGGGNFGVVTRFGFRLYRPTEIFTSILMSLSHDRIGEMLARWQDYAPHARNELTTLLNLESGKFGVSYAALFGLYAGGKEEAKKALAPLLKPNSHSDLRLSDGKYEKA